MLREQMINFLQAAVVFLLITNALSALVAMYAMRMINGPAGQVAPAFARKLAARLGRSE